MKYSVSVFVLGLMFAIGAHTTHAQVVGEIATSTPVSGMGGYSTPCFYLRQTNEWNKGYVCNDADHSMIDFVFSDAKREAILAPWRQHIFVEVAAKYGTARSY